MLKKILINVEATPHCPAACSMCPRSIIKDSGFIALDLMEKIVDQVDPSFVWELSLAGRGEPTIHPDFHEVLKIMGRSKVPTDVTTTGVALTQRNIDACIKELDIVRLSVSSVRKEVFDRVHIGLNYQKIWQNISALAEANANKVVVHLTGGPAIYSTLPETVKYLRKLGFKRFKLFPLWNRGGNIDAEVDRTRRQHLAQELNLELSESEFKTGMGKLGSILNAAIGKAINRKFCIVGDSSISISHSGEILGCFQDFGHTSNIGHMNNTHLKKIMNERTKLLGNMKICQNCNSRQAILKKF